MRFQVLHISLLLMLFFASKRNMAQPTWVDPIYKMEHGIFKEVDTVRAFMQYGEQDLLVYEKTYYDERYGMRDMKRFDHDKKSVFISEYSPDSSAYAERIRNERMKVIYAIEWKNDENGRLIHQSKSEKKGRRMLIFNTDNDYQFDKQDRLIKMKSVYSLDNFENYKRKTITTYKYNDLDSLESEFQVTRRGLKTLHAGEKHYEYDPNGRLLKKIAKNNKLTEVSFYEYDEKNRLAKIRTDAGKAYEEVFFEYLNGKLSKRFVYSFDGVSMQYNSWSYSPTEKLLVFCENRDSMVYERLANDSLISITNYKLDKNKEVKGEILMLKQEFMNGVLLKRNSFEEKNDQVIRLEETFEYDDQARLVKYMRIEKLKEEYVSYVIKTYKYDSRDWLSEYTVEHPLSKMKRLFYYTISF